jgi:tetratricopeptide (TPR) repeat protein
MTMKYPEVLGCIAALVLFNADRAVAKTAAEIEEIGRAVTVEIKLQKTAKVGSGVIIHQQGDLYTVVTNRHVVCGDRNCPSLPTDEIYNLGAADGQVYQVPIQKVKLMGNGLDLAVIQFRSSRSYAVAQVAEVDGVRVDDLVYTTGFPLEQPSFKFGEGKAIAVVNKRLTQDRGGYTVIYDAYTLPGMSGGGVFNRNGQLVAIHGMGDRYQENTEIGNRSQVGNKIGYNRGIPIRWVVKGLGQQGIVVSQQQLSNLLNKTNSTTSTTADEHFIAAFNRSVDPGVSVWAGKQEAIRELNKAILLNPRYVIAYHLRAYLHAQLQSYQQAVADYSQSIALNPKFARAYNNRGLLKAERLNDLSGALADYNQAIATNPKYAAAYYNRGLLKAERLNDISGALADYNQALAINPKFSLAYYDRGNLKANKLKDPSSALVDYNRAIATSPQYGDAYNNRGLLKADQLKDFKGALADFDAAISIDPQDAGAYYNRGLLKNNKLKDPTGAIEDFRIALKLFRQKGEKTRIQYAVTRLRELGVAE